MKLLLLQISDIHFKEDGTEVFSKIDKMVASLNEIGTIERVIIMLNGDIAHSGAMKEYKNAGQFMSKLTRTLKSKLRNLKHRWIDVIVVPGNHDIARKKDDLKFEDIVEGYKNNNIVELYNKDIDRMNNFWSFASFNKCFEDDKDISYKSINVDGYKIGFTLLNTAPLSMLGSTNQDKGSHYINCIKLEDRKYHNDFDLNILIAHHNYEWLHDYYKSDLRDFIEEFYSLVFIGHEHDGNVEDKVVNDVSQVVEVQGNTLSGDTKHKSGFVSIMIDTLEQTLNGYSHVWNEDYFKVDKVLDSKIITKKGNTENKLSREMQDFLKKEDSKFIDDFFVFPDIYCMNFTEDVEIEEDYIEDIDALVQLVTNVDRVVINGENKSGKTTLAKKLYYELFNMIEGCTPLYLGLDELRHKKYERIIRNAFEDQYDTDSSSYDKYSQLDKEKKVLIIDDVDRVNEKNLNNFLQVVGDSYSCVILFCSKKIDIDIKKQVSDLYVYDKQVKLMIRPFLYKKRSELIDKVYSKLIPELSDEDKREKVNHTNSYINNNIKYFDLDPGFLVKFVSQYANNFSTEIAFNNNKDVFSMVYENDIRSRIIKNTEPKFVSHIFVVLQEVAFYMHFNKKSSVDTHKLTEITEQYNEDYRAKINYYKVYTTGIQSGLLKGHPNEIKFGDSNILAYFVALAVSRKQEFEEIDEEIIYLLDNLCFGINSDIILFIALIKNSSKVLNIILAKASEHFKEYDEFDFSKKEFDFISNTSFEVEEPDMNDKRKKIEDKNTAEERIVSQEIEVKDEYDYDGEVKTLQDKMFISLKYIELISKILPSFSHVLKRKQQDELLTRLYAYPNQFLHGIYSLLGDNFDETVKVMYEEVLAMNHIANKEEFTIESLRKNLQEICIGLIVNLYDYIADVSSSDNTIEILNDFNYEQTENYYLMNVMMQGNVNNVKDFSDKAISLYNSSDVKLVKGIVRYAVRNYLVDHDVRLFGPAQAMYDKFFPIKQPNTYFVRSTSTKLKSRINSNTMRSIKK